MKGKNIMETKKHIPRRVLKCILGAAVAAGIITFIQFLPEKPPMDTSFFFLITLFTVFGIMWPCFMQRSQSDGTSKKK